MNPLDLRESLSPDRRMALGYAPAAERQTYLAFYALDARLSTIVLNAREPMLAQIKLAWWREQLVKPLDERPSGEPVLAALSACQGGGAGWSVLADGWEWLLGEAPQEAEAIEGFAGARGAACQVLAQMLNCDGSAMDRVGRNWALSDLAGIIGVVPAITAATERSDWSRPRLERPLRPLLVQHEQACHNKNNGFGGVGLSGFVTSARLGLLGI